MHGSISSSSPDRIRRGARPGSRGFTLTELLVVMSIIGLITYIALPAFRGFGQENVVGTAQRQIQDDLAYARLQAIKNRAPVYMVFLQPPFQQDANFARDLNQAHQRLLLLPQASDEDRKFRDSALRVFTNAFPLQFSGYALYTEASVGEQPGVRRRRYLTEWRPLPEGALFPTNGLQIELPPFVSGIQNRTVFTNLTTLSVPFPVGPDRAGEARELPVLDLPAIGFDAQGRLYNFLPNGRPRGNGTTLADRFLAVGIGSALFQRKTGAGTNQYNFEAIPDVVETPRKNYTNHILRVSALSGRTKYQKPPQP
ncbi:MAG: prepilin-type N-terminal cleavage/methylation domain-containing protein [Verrucomicrobia bacterium]|nr:prepilin-type N-terminal cleavage/methylation domain-containing protein [Verrucomicrobiota bacterium]